MCVVHVEHVCVSHTAGRTHVTGLCVPHSWSNTCNRFVCPTQLGRIRGTCLCVLHSWSWHNKGRYKQFRFFCLFVFFQNPLWTAHYSPSLMNTSSSVLTGSVSRNTLLSFKLRTFARIKIESCISAGSQMPNKGSRCRNGAGSCVEIHNFHGWSSGS